MFKSTKIISTLGPATDSIKIISSLVDSGTDVFRLNFSHGNHKTHGKVIDLIREVEIKLNIPLSIIVDLQGPKYRIGKIKSTFLKKGDLIKFHNSDFRKNEVKNSYNIKTEIL